MGETRAFRHITVPKIFKKSIKLITSIHTRTLNEMSQQLTTILQKLNTTEEGEPNKENSRTHAA